MLWIFYADSADDSSNAAIRKQREMFHKCIYLNLLYNMVWFLSPYSELDAMNEMC